MPEIVQFKNGNQIRNTYDASGRKLGMRYATVQQGVFNPIIPGEVIENLDVSELDNVSITGTDYVDNIEYNVTRYFDWDVTYEPQEGKSLWRVYNPEGYTTHIRTSMTHGPIYHYYRKDHLGNNREVWRASHLWNGNTRAAATVQRTQYYPSGLPWASNSGDNPGTQSKKYNGKEWVEMHGLDEYDSEARWYYPAIMRTTTIDPLAEKYYSISPYAWCENNPLKYVDLKGDSLTLGGNVEDVILAIYNGLSDGSNVSMKFNNGVLDPKSIEEQAVNSSDFFLKNIYEISINPNMVELTMSNSYDFIDSNGRKDNNMSNPDMNWVDPYDYSDDDLGTGSVAGLKAAGLYTSGRTVQGNTGRTLFPQSKTGAKSTNGNIQVIINANGSLNHRTIGLNHEFWHVISYMRGLPHTDGSPTFNKSVNIIDYNMKKRLGYDY